MPHLHKLKTFTSELGDLDILKLGVFIPSDKERDRQRDRQTDLCVQTHTLNY